MIDSWQFCCSDDSCGNHLRLRWIFRFIGVAWLCSSVPVYQRDVTTSTAPAAQRIGVKNTRRNAILCFVSFCKYGVIALTKFSADQKFPFPNLSNRGISLPHTISRSNNSLSLPPPFPVPFLFDPPLLLSMSPTSKMRLPFLLTTHNHKLPPRLPILTNLTFIMSPLLRHRMLSNGVQ